MPNTETFQELETKMSLLDYIAVRALPAVASSDSKIDPVMVAKECYELAEAFMNERKKYQS